MAPERDRERAELRAALDSKTSELEEISDRRAFLEREIRGLELRLADRLPPNLDDGSAAATDRVLRPRTTRTKIELFRSLFRGREDVYARWWENLETGRSGYSPVRILNPNQGSGGGGRDGATPVEWSHAPLTDDVVYSHLKGREFIGVYPLMKDESCWFLAADFDGPNWRSDVSAFRSAAADNQVPVAIERSRSGNGAHAWVFFDEPVPAAVARRLGSYLISVAMDARHQISMESYDRLFPNQDTMPAGGFGNLIALPFQGRAQASGNTLFLDEDLRPFQDQWEFLAGVGRLDLQTATSLSARAKEYERSITLRPKPDFEQSLILPWDLPPSRNPAPVTSRDADSSPEVIGAHLANRLFVSKAGLKSPVINALKRIAVLHNPEFYRKQRNREFTGRTQRLISYFEDFPGHVGLPRGCVPEAEAILESLGSRLSITDVRQTGDAIDLNFNGRLDEAQAKSLRNLTAEDFGVLVAPPGSGKTVVAIAAIAQRSRDTLILVHRQQLMDHWTAQLSKLLGEDASEFGRIGGGRSKITGRIDVAMFQSLVRKGEVKDLVANYGHVVVDECHHVPAVTFALVLSEVKARYAIGLTATPNRDDGLQAVIRMQLGPLRRATATAAALDPVVAKRLLVRESDFQIPDAEREYSFQELCTLLIADEGRNRQIIHDVLEVVGEGRSPIVLTDRLEHLDRLAESLVREGIDPVVLKGGATPARRRQMLESLEAARNESRLIVLSTIGYAGEGFDVAELDTLFLTTPISGRSRLRQCAGRLDRPHHAKSELRIYDYADRRVPQLAGMFQGRLAGYKKIGYASPGDWAG